MRPEILKQIELALKDLRYGSLEIVVHDSRVVQIEKKEKLRFGAENHNHTGADRTAGSSISTKGEVK